jgi:hypothetical protein
MSRLYYLIEPDGGVRVYLYLIGQLKVELNSDLLEVWKNLLTEHFSVLNNIFILNHITHGDARYFINFVETLSAERIHFLNSDSLQFLSATYYLPISFERGLHELQMVFAALYLLLDTSIHIEEGQPSRFNEMLKAYINWYQNDGQVMWYEKYAEAETDERNEEIEIPELDSYQFIRAGLWWEILARDNWTCCSCGRSVKEHGITLHVDHIIPRSKGGTDERENLQTLCVKCNIGKSNRDQTNLTRRL